MNRRVIIITTFKNVGEHPVYLSLEYVLCFPLDDEFISSGE